MLNTNLSNLQAENVRLADELHQAQNQVIMERKKER